MNTADRDQVVNLLTKGFAAWRRRSFWAEALDRLAQRDVPAGLPQLGYVLEAGGAIVGALLVIGSSVGGLTRCNVSGWYVEPEYRPFGTLLVHKALRLRDVVTMNVTPAPETWDTLAAQGYQRYAEGRVLFLPALARRGGGSRVRRVDASGAGASGLGADEVRLLADHARWDCLSFVCERDGEAAPFVFGRRLRHGVPFAYLLYCRSLDSLLEHARSLGWALLRHGMLFVVTDANGKLPGMPCRYQDGFPNYYRGATAPHPGDLAYTERAIFGA